jgi:TPR repeat protein
MFSPRSATAEALTDGLIRYAVRDYAGARKILEPLAHGGDADAQLQLGTMYSNGEGVSRDPAEAAKWFVRAAERGKAEAQFALGMMYLEGVGVPADETLAFGWLLGAAEQESTHALNAIGELVMRSLHPSQDYSDAVAWFERAARLGNSKALYNLGMLYAFGRGVTQDAVEAYKWFDLAASEGLGDEREAASRALIDLRERMTPFQVGEGQRSAHAWFQRQVSDSETAASDRAKNRQRAVTSTNEAGAVANGGVAFTRGQLGQ